MISTPQQHVPVIAVTRSCTKPFSLPGTEVRDWGVGESTREELLAFVPGATVIVSMYNQRIDAEVLDAAGPKLKAVCNHAVGYNNIDLDACKERGVIVTNTPDAVTEGTANMAWLMVMACARLLLRADRLARDGSWEAYGSYGMAEHVGLELTDRKLLILGAGRIGYATALRSLGWSMEIGYVARTRHMEFEISPFGGQQFELEEGLAWADVVSVHVPLSEATRHLLDERRLRLMKSEAILVNTARGPIIDEDALARVMNEGHLWGAGLDVFEHEPKVHPGLVGLDNVIMSPHLGSAERRYRHAMVDLIEEDIRAILAGKEPPRRVG